MNMNIDTNMIRLRNAFGSAKKRIYKKKRYHLTSKPAVSNLSECARLEYKFPPEVEALIKEYAQPVYRMPLHFKAVNTLFVFQKRGMMKFALDWMCPECNHPLLKTRMNVNYREAQMKYRKQSIGEIYEQLSFAIFASETHGHGLFKRDILKTSRNLLFVQDGEGKPVMCNSAPLTCTNIYIEILTGTFGALFVASPYALSMSYVFYIPISIMIFIFVLQHTRIHYKYIEN